MMTAWNRPLFAAAGILAVTLLLALVSAPPAHTQGPPARPATPVEVLNTPLPVTGNLNATVAGTVQVGNTLLPVQATNDTLNEPYSEFRPGILGDGQDTKILTFDVPDGKRLVIETVTVLAEVQPGQKAVASLVTQGPGGEVSRFLTVESQGMMSGRDQLAGTHPIKARVDGTAATDEVVIRFFRSPVAGGSVVFASVDGYLVVP